jgi:prolipoprotein diacylglyceryltransferase
VLQLVARRRPLRGTLTAAYLGLQGMTLLLVEALRADSLLLPAGVRAGQVFGLALVLLGGMLASRQSAAAMAGPRDQDDPAPTSQLDNSRTASAIER